MKAVIGFLENIDFDEGAIKLAEKRQADPMEIRERMNDQLKEMLLSERVPYVGPTKGVKCPEGGYFFKLNTKKRPPVLRKFVLRRLDLADSLKVRSKAIKNYEIPVGLLVKVYANDENPRKLSFDENNAWDLAACVDAYYSQRTGKITPYFIEADRKFFEKYSVSEFLL